MPLTPLLQADAACTIADFGESIQYRRKSDPDNAVTIAALIDRDPLQCQAEDRGRSVASPIEISIAVTDIAAIDTNGDAVSLRWSSDSRPLGSDRNWLPNKRLRLQCCSSHQLSDPGLPLW